MLPGLKKNPDGSLTLYIQKDSPGTGKESNWLPAPDGPIYLVMRLYWPKETPPSILPPGEGTWKPPGVSRYFSRRCCLQMSAVCCCRLLVPNPMLCPES
jgi:hypothetical protein